jgi:SAM-dependent methyltransferase
VHTCYRFFGGLGGDVLRYTFTSPPLATMNSAEHYFCSSSLWGYLTRRQLLPWLLSGARLGEHVLELGAGYGAATAALGNRVSRVTSLDYDAASIQRLRSKHGGDASAALCGDAARLPFADETFTSAVGILVLHHLQSRELQDRMFAEVFRVLRPGGVLLAFEITDTWLNRAIHYKSTFTPLAPGSAFARLTSAGFSRVSVDFRRGGFRLSAARAKQQVVSPDGESAGHATPNPDDRKPVTTSEARENASTATAGGKLP